MVLVFNNSGNKNGMFYQKIIPFVFEYSLLQSSYRQIPTTTDKYRHVNLLVGICRYLSVLVGICRYLSVFVGISRYLSVFVGSWAEVGPKYIYKKN